MCFAIGAPHDADNEILDDALLDGPLTDASLDGPAYIPWGTPVELTSLETSGTGETDPSVAANKLTAVLSADTAVNDGDIYIATRTALTNTFSFVALTAVNASGFDDTSPELSADGKTLYLVSNRGGSREVYISTFSTVWSTPTVVPFLSTGGTVGDLAVSADGLTAAVVREGTPNRIYLHKRQSTSAAFDTGALHTELNVTGDIAAPTITNNGAIIYLHAGSPRDIYRATLKSDGTYTVPMPVTELNMSAIREAAPFVTEADDYMIFDRSGDIYETTR